MTVMMNQMANTTHNIISTLMIVAAIVGTYMIFQKANEKGWKAIVPFYNNYVMYDLFWRTKLFWIEFAAGILCVISAVTAYVVSANHIFLAIAVVISIITAAISIMLDVMLMSRVAKAFGHGLGFTLGLVFLKGIFLMILGFDKDEFHRAPVHKFA